MSAIIPENLSEDGSTRARSICFLVLQSAPSLLLMKDRPKQFCPRCIATNLVPQIPLCFPPFSLMHRVLRKVELEKVPSLILIALTWQSETWYPELIHLSMKNPPTLTSTSKSLKEPSKGNTPFFKIKQ